ncbi:hypothetical protein E8E12_001468 [Didymella heteroderae]|uniref:Rhodopsin domain-containing protein n=1 Tax=Didymella heteroderae TaxID=1769908 RepID=A0A9P4WFY3_9PLEO|nr:hypothetical protein E8E12_001468 [Didymella heteroderae]
MLALLSILALGGWICFVLQGYFGLGRHSRVVSKQDLITFEKISFFQAIISAIGALGMLKISIALFLLRLIQNKWYSRALWALIGFVVIYTIGAWLTFFLRCRPMGAFWDPGLGGTCYPMELFKSFAMANTGFNIGTDVLSATLPIPIIWSLQMSQRTKVYIIGILSLGYLAVAMGIAKTVFQLTLVTNKDRTFESSVQFWGFLQLNVGIIAATAPTLRPLLRKSSLTTSENRYNQFDANDRLTHFGHTQVQFKSTSR